MISLTEGTTDKIASVKATLSGVAGSLDIDQLIHSSPSKVETTFIKITSGDYAGKLGATVRLLGVVESEQQKLNVTMTFTNGNSSSFTSEHDLSALLSGFNSDKKTPMTLGAQVTEIPAETGFNATITDWTMVAGTGSAN